MIHRLKPWKDTFFHSNKFSSVNEFVEKITHDKILNAYLSKNLYDYEGLEVGVLKYKNSSLKNDFIINGQKYFSRITTEVKYGLTIIQGDFSNQIKWYFQKEPIINLPEEPPMLSDTLHKVDVESNIEYDNYPSLSDLVKEINTTLKRPLAHIRNILPLYK